MPAHFAIVIMLAMGAVQPPELCAGVESSIEPDMRILESDLDKAAASKAVAWLAERIEGDELDGEFTFGVWNGMKVLHGYVLRHQAMVERERLGADSVEAVSATRTFCEWLAREGFWYD